MFLVEGLAASLVGVWAYSTSPTGPRDAAWMPARQQAALEAAIATENAAKSAHGAVHLGAIFRNPLLAHFALTYFSIAICGYGIAFYLPAQVSALLGTKIGLGVTLVTSIPWLCAFAVSAFWPGLAQRSGRRRTFAVVSRSLRRPRHDRVRLPAAARRRAGALRLVAGLISAQPIFWTFPMGYFGGFARRPAASRSSTRSATSAASCAEPEGRGGRLGRHRPRRPVGDRRRRAPRLPPRRADPGPGRAQGRGPHRCRLLQGGAGMTAQNSPPPGCAPGWRRASSWRRARRMP